MHKFMKTFIPFMTCFLVLCTFNYLLENPVSYIIAFITYTFIFSIMRMAFIALNLLDNTDE